MNSVTRVYLLAAACLLLPALACGDDDDKGSCEQLAARMCEWGCSCVPASAADNDCCMGTSLGDTRCYSRNMCTVAFTRDLCGDTSKPQELFTSCSALIDTNKCVKQGADRYAILPTACNELLECKAGPCLD